MRIRPKAALLGTSGTLELEQGRTAPSVLDIDPSKPLPHHLSIGIRTATINSAYNAPVTISASVANFSLLAETQAREQLLRAVAERLTALGCIDFSQSDAVLSTSRVKDG